MDGHSPDALRPQASHILAFDTSTPKGKCSLLCASGNAAEAALEAEVRISKTLLPQVKELLDSKNVSSQMIQAIGVSVGPGTFTGLRVGLSCAKGLALGLGCPLYGFSSMETMAMGALLHSLEMSQGLPDYILPYRDARYGELFTALFQVVKNPESPRESGLLRIQEDQIIKREEFRLPVDGNTLLAGTKEELPEILPDRMTDNTITHDEVDSSAVAVGWLTRRAIANQTPPASANVSLNYCRKPQAQTKWADPGG